MSGFLKNVVGGIRGIVDAASANINPYKVQTGKQEDYNSLVVKLREGNLVLFRRQASYECVLVNPGVTTKVYSVFRLTNEAEALAQFKRLNQILNVLLQCSSSVFQEQILQKICDASREHHSWTTAHVAAHVGLYECFKHQAVYSFLNHTCAVFNNTPLMTAMLGKQHLCVQELLQCGASLDIVDVDGNSVYHKAVLIYPDAIPLFTPYDRKKVIDHVNQKGQTALSIACEKGLADSVEKLLQAGANPNISATETLPIHLAVKASSIRCVELLCENHADQVLMKDRKHGGSAVHWARTKQMVDVLGRLGSDVNLRSNTGHTPLHVMMEKSRLDCVMEILCYGADTRVMDNQGNTPLHLAVKNDDADMVKTLVVFGADVNWCNAQNQSARHLAATSSGKNKDAILFMLHISGARRCKTNVKGCLNGCCFEGSHDGTRDPTMSNMMEADKDAILDEMLASMSGQNMSKLEEAGLDMTDSSTLPGDRVLCLDGGGIRGLVLIQMLMAIQDEAGIPIKDCFDWIGGTSTGGLLALGIVCDKSLTYMKGLYFRLKDEVFTGSRPYASEPFEVMLKREFGETNTMTDIKEPKVFVTAVYGDRYPPEQHLFRNYHTTIQRDFSTDDKGSKFQPPPQPEDQLIWQAARSSGAAPTYFRSAGRFVDGGLMANNPTLDMLTEIHEFNTGLKLRNQSHMVRKLACVVSLGTGRVPVVQNLHIDVYRPEGIMDIHKVAKGVTGLINTLIEQATVSEGRPVDRARAWCSMLDVPFARFSPRLSENTPLDCHDNKSLMKMMWDTQCYIVANKHRIQNIAEILKRNYRPRSVELPGDAKL